MSRLIDADELKDSITKLYNGTDGEMLCKLVDMTPTAYDVWAVVGEITKDIIDEDVDDSESAQKINTLIKRHLETVRTGGLKDKGGVADG